MHTALAQGAGVAVVTRQAMEEGGRSAAPALASGLGAWVAVIAVRVRSAALGAFINHAVTVVIELVAELHRARKYRRVLGSAVRRVVNPVAITVIHAGGRFVNAGAILGIAGICCAIISVVAIDRGASAFPLLTTVIGRTRVRVVAAVARQRHVHALARDRVAAINGAIVPVIAGPGRVETQGVRVRRLGAGIDRTWITVVTEHMQAAPVDLKDVQRAAVLVVAGNHGMRTAALYAVILGLRVPVVAVQGVVATDVLVDTADLRITARRRTRVSVVAGERFASPADGHLARFPHGARVTVIARSPVHEGINNAGSLHAVRVGAGVAVIAVRQGQARLPARSAPTTAATLKRLFAVAPTQAIRPWNNPRCAQG